MGRTVAARGISFTSLSVKLSKRKSNTNILNTVDTGLFAIYYSINKILLPFHYYSMSKHSSVMLSK